MKIIIQLAVLLLPILTYSQTSQLSIFDNLVGKTWQAEGNWSNGSRFFQEIRFEYSLDSAIVTSESIGFVDAEQTKLGKRNHGIRQLDKESNIIRFWEFDIFGGVTMGSVSVEGKNLLYQYDYGDSKLTDMWEHIDDSTYNFKVGEYLNGHWSQVYLSTQFKQTNTLGVEEIYSMAKKHLTGLWSSPAWDGQLDELWSIDNHGHIVQSAQYIENQKVLFESKNKMEIVDNELILFTVIKGNNPKIFKATSWTENSIVFENSDYTNPNKVIYKFISENEFDRSISGIENNEISNYTFKFKIQK